ncbi:MAG: YceI family protein [Candidatus Peribacteria bacterium]|nr:MAG: YceI family protein [Candidatus Peribacteria bacterium]
MKKVSLVLSVLFVALFVAGCTKKATPAVVDTTTTADNNQQVAVADLVPSDEIPADAFIGLQIDAAASSIEWTGTKVTGLHTGTVAIKSGVLRTDPEGVLVDGGVTADMTTITSDTEAVTKHLMSEDFFNVPEFPTSMLKITKVVPTGTDNEYTATAELTIKGITNIITFPLTWAADGDVYRGSARFDIDRTLWDIRYGSLKFFSDLADKAINDMIQFQVNIVTK